MADIAVMSETILSEKEKAVSPSLLLTPIVMDNAKRIEFIVDMDDKTFLDKDAFLDVRIEVSDDGVKWKLISGFTWHGGPKYLNDGSPDYNRPGIGTTEINRYIGKYVRAAVETKNKITVSAKVVVK